jgi:hypothetical protein|tara:strand:- start:275 stop:478 length:204 start_codon:yes stop_codon:yes gene_type:complete
MLVKLIFLLSLTELKGSGGEQLFIEADNQVNNSFTTAQNNNYLAISPISITPGSVLTVAEGSIIDFF